MKNKLEYRLFGRVKSRKKIDRDKYKNILDKYNTFDLNIKDNNILDIGTGYGESSLYLSKKYLKSKIYTCDKYINGNFNLLKKIEEENLQNIRVHDGNVYEVLDQININKYFNSIYIFFPDPWPKKKHNKRRLIDVYFLKKIFNYLKPNGNIYISTDSVNYFNSILLSCYKTKNMYNWVNQHCMFKNYKDYFPFETKYYKKAINSGRLPLFLILEKL